MGCSSHGLHFPLYGELLVGCLFHVMSFLAADGCLLELVFFLLVAEILREDLDEMLETLSFA